MGPVTGSRPNRVALKHFGSPRWALREMLLGCPHTMGVFTLFRCLLDALWEAFASAFACASASQTR